MTDVWSSHHEFGQVRPSFAPGCLLLHCTSSTTLYRLSTAASVAWLTQAARGFRVEQRVCRRTHTFLAVHARKARIAHTHSFVVFELARTIATADGAVLILWALLGTCGPCPVLVAFARSCTVGCFKRALSVAIANAAWGRRALVAAGWALEAFLAVALGSLAILGRCAHPASAANLAVLASWAWDAAVVTQEPPLAHALHALLWGRDTLSLVVARLLSSLVEWAGLLADATTEALLAKALGLESFSFLVADKETLTIP